MKPNEIQDRVCSTIITEIKCWSDTNDISSPTIPVDMHDNLNAQLEDIIDDVETIDIIETHLLNILNIIRKL